MLLPNIRSPGPTRLTVQHHLYPSFRASRKHIVPHIKPFSREEYLEQLQSQISEHCTKAHIPEEFALWIMEWPENAVIGWAWPGLDADFDSMTRKRGILQGVYLVEDSDSAMEERVQKSTLPLVDLDKDFESATRKKGRNRILQRQEVRAHWWRTYGCNMLCLPGDEGKHNRLYWSQVDDDQPYNSNLKLLGMYVQFHGCTLYTILFFDCDSARDGMVWAGDDINDIKTVDHWREGPGLKSGWIEWLNMELKAIEDQYC
jgi:hypothetical protein